METPVLDLTRDQILAGIERGLKQRGLFYSAADLVQAYRDGRLGDPAAVADLIALTALLTDDDSPFVRP